MVSSNTVDSYKEIIQNYISHQKIKQYIQLSQISK